MTVSAVLQTSFLGDMVLTTPLIARLAASGPVHVVATPANASILANHPAVASVIVYDKRGRDRGWRGIRRVAHALRATGADTAYLAQGSVRTALVSRLAGIPHRIGFATSPGRWWYTRLVPYDRGRHHAERLVQLAGADTTALPHPLQPSLHPGATDIAAVDALLAAHGVATNAMLVALAPGSVWATKRWPSFDALAAAIAASLPAQGARIIVIGGAGDQALARAIVDAVASVASVAAATGASGATDVPVVDATGKLSLLASAELIRRARVLVTNDSAPLHLASAMGTPTVALFGPTVPALGFGPLGTEHALVEVASLPCRPCGAHGPQHCPLDHWRCMRELDVTTVRKALTPWIEHD